MTFNTTYQEGDDRMHGEVCKNVQHRVDASPKKRHLDLNRLGLYGRDGEIKALSSAFFEMLRAHAKHQKSEASNDLTTHHMTIPTQVVWIEGPSGSGKSALVHQLKGPVQEAGCFFVTGKFDLPHTQREYNTATSSLLRDSTKIRGQQQTLLYQGIRIAFDQLCQQILDLPRCDDLLKTAVPSHKKLVYFEDAKQSLVKGLKDSLDVLGLLAPKLVSIIRNGDEPSSGSSHPRQQNFHENADRLRYVCRKLIQIVSIEIAPIVLVMDDLQWADQASLDLLKLWISDSQTAGIMLVGCYRSEEVNAVGKGHPLFSMVEDMASLPQKGPSPVFVSRKIILQNLGISEIEDLLETLLQSHNAPGATLELADIVLSQTGGNSFHVIEFIQLLTKKNHLLEYNPFTKMWEWDEEAIKRQTATTDSIASLMQELLNHSIVARNLLPVAACLGSTVSTNILFNVFHSLEQSPAGFMVKDLKNVPIIDSDKLYVPAKDLAAMEHQLNQCVDEGFLTPIRQGMYCFSHDQIQEAASNLLCPSSEFQIGNAVLESCEQEDQLDGDLIFSILDMLNPKAATLKSTDPKRMQIIKLNHTAADLAMKASSFQTASFYFRQAISLLPAGDTRWTSDKLYDLTLNLYTEAALAEAGKKDEEAMLDFAVNGVQKHGRNIYDKLPVLHMLMDWFLSREDAQKSVDIGLTILNHLGVHIPGNQLLLTGSVVSGLLKSKKLVLKNVGLSINEIPVAKDIKTKAIIRTMDKMSTSAYFVNKQLLALTIFTATRTMFTTGVTNESCLILSGYGLAMTNKLGDYYLGRMCAERAIELVQQPDALQFRARVTFLTYGMNLHLMKPIKNLVPLLLEGTHQGIQSGDFESAVLCAFFYVQAMFDSSKNLSTIESECAHYTELADDFGIEKFALVLRGFWQAMLNLMGDPKNKNVEVLTGTQLILDEVEAKLAGKPNGLGPFRKLQMINAAFSGRHEFGANMALENGDSVLEETLGQVGSATYRLANALSCYHMIQSHTHTPTCFEGLTGKHGKYLAYAKKCHKQIKDWVEKAGSPNIRHFAALLDAEAGIFAGEDRTKIIQHFEEALAFARQKDFRRDEALISERYALFWKGQHDHVAFKKHAIAAMTLYQQWGAHALVKVLAGRWKHDLRSLLDELPSLKTSVTLNGACTLALA